jgi:hypothetical protein
VPLPASVAPLASGTTTARAPAASATLAPGIPFAGAAMDFGFGSPNVLSLPPRPSPPPSTSTGATAVVYADWITRGSTGSVPILAVVPLPTTTPIRAPTPRPFAMAAPPPSLQATSSASNLPHLTLQQFLHLQRPKPLVYQDPICKYPNRSIASPTVVVYPDVGHRSIDSNCIRHPEPGP